MKHDSRARHNRYSVEDTCSLLRDMGIRDTSAFEANGITGADLLDLEEDDLRSELGLSKLQVDSLLMLPELQAQQPLAASSISGWQVAWHPTKHGMCMACHRHFRLQMVYQQGCGRGRG